MNNVSSCTSFLEFLNSLAEDKLIPGFTESLIKTPNEEDNYYYSMGDRWCSVEDILKPHDNFNTLLYKFAFEGLDPDFAFSSCNLKASYLPDEDFINDGSALVIFSLVGANWLHTVGLKNQLPLWKKLKLID
jgi:hypothetical protein